ncbi:uncharacterized protein LOC101235467 isoform X1 [Hydra vulgaris]|nr:uncharacterized protein LOC101235467 [Hydra vulgaris]
MLSKLIRKKNILRQHVSRLYYRYGTFCSQHPILLLGFSISVVVVCSLPLTSFPLFEKILAFLFQRVIVNYKTHITPISQNLSEFFEDKSNFAYVQQIIFKVNLIGKLNLTNDQLIESTLHLPLLQELDEQLRNPSSNDDWIGSCLKLVRDPPSMMSIRKRITFSYGRFHNDLKNKKFFNMKCLFISPILAINSNTTNFNDLSTSFKELLFGHLINEKEWEKKENIFITFTLFFQKENSRFKEQLISGFMKKNLTVESNGHLCKINYEFSDESGPSELIPLTIAYTVVFFYLWFSTAKVEFLRTRWGLAFSAVMNFLMSFNMAIGICVMFDVLPTTLNVGQIFPYVVILIGIENFWIITKSVMSTKKDFEVKHRIALGLGMEGWYITKNLLVEILLLFIGYASGIGGMQEFSVFALACYLSDFFLQFTFFVPILAVDVRRAEVGLPFTDSSAWKYAFCIDIEKPGAMKSHPEISKHRFSAALKLSFGVARYRVLQRSIMILILIYFAMTVSYPYHSIGQNNQNNSNQPLVNKKSCMSEGQDTSQINATSSWLLLCGKHWPELFNYYFVHLNGRSLVLLPEIIVKFNVTDKQLSLSPRELLPSTFWDVMISYISQLSNPGIAACCVIFLTFTYKLLKMAQKCVLNFGKGTNIYLSKINSLVVPNKKFLFKINAMVVDEADTLICSFNNGSIYVWDLYKNTCVYYIDRRTCEVKAFGLPKSTSTWSLSNEFIASEQVQNRLPLAVWSLAYKSDVLIAGCEQGCIEVYSLENATLQCRHVSEDCSGIVSIQVISCLRFVAAHEDGVVEFYQIKAKHIGHKRTSSLPDQQLTSFSLEVSRTVSVFNQPIVFMEIAIHKIFISSTRAQVKVLRASDDGGIPMHSNIINDQQITAMKVEKSPEVAIIGTNTGNIYILNSVVQTVKSLCCGGFEVLSVCSDDNYIAALTFDGVLTVWLKEGYIKWWQVNLLSYGGAFEILSMARYTLAVVTQDTVILLNVMSRNIVDTFEYTEPSPGIIMVQPVVCQNKSSIVLPCGNKVVHLQFPNLVERDR